MDWDEPVGPDKKLFEPLVLDRLSVDELTEYIADMEAEIARVKAHIAGQQEHEAEASKLFKS